MLTEISSTLGVISNSLTIKDKLLKRNKCIANLEPKKSKYCSIFLEHSFPHGNFRSLGEHTLELTLCQLSHFTIPIRHLDWVIWEGSIEEVKPVDFQLPKLWSLPSQACLLSLEVNQVLNSRLKYVDLSGKDLRKTVRNMYLQCVYADGFRQTLSIPDSLQLAIFYKFYKSKRLFNWHQFLILNT